MINIHLYPSPLVSESRMEREAGSLRKLRLFDEIILVGVGKPSLPASEDKSGIRLHRIGEKRSVNAVGKLIDTMRWSAAVYRQYRDAKVACINCHSIAVLPLSVLLKARTGARLVYDAHELESEANGLKGIRKALTKLAERFFIRYADHCIFVGAAIEKWYVRQYGLRNTTVLYNCPARQDVPQSGYFREALSIPRDQAIFLYQGVIGEGRGVRILIEAFSALKDRAALVVMGYGPLAAWCAEQAAQFENIHYHAAVAPENLLSYTAAADYGVSLIEATSMSYEYCMPNKLFEYLMAGKPVLVSPTVEQREFVQQYNVGEVASDLSPQAVRGAVQRLLERTPERYAIAIDLVRQEYCWERQEAKLKAIYVEALGFSARPVGAAV